MPPTSPGRLLSTRLFICLSLGMLLCLALISLWNYVPIHYRYVSKTTLGTGECSVGLKYAPELLYSLFCFELC